MSKRERRTAYEKWIEGEGIPVVEGYGVTDVQQLELAEWPRAGGKGAYIQLTGLEGITGLYVGEIAPRSGLKLEKHLYEEVICILSGTGETEIMLDGYPTRRFDWQEGSLFSPPLNTTHRLINTGPAPVRFIGVTTAPMIFDNLHNEEFILNTGFVFKERYQAQEDYFVPGEHRYLSENNKQWILETNLIPDLRTLLIDAQGQKGAGVLLTQFEISENTLIGHLADWPVGRYHKAHYHGGGAVLLILRSEGYTLMWPNAWGPKPYEKGHGAEVVRVDWQVGSVVCPPTGWFHQHFNTGAEPALQLALRCGSSKHPLGIRVSHIRAGVYKSVKEGGTLIEYEDEDPEIKRIYEASLQKTGVASAMP